MNYLNIDDFLKDEQLFEVVFNEPIFQTKLYKGCEPGKKVELPVFACKFLLKYEHCELSQSKEKSKNKTLLEKHKEDFIAQADIVDLNNNHFYSFINLYTENDASKIDMAVGDSNEIVEDNDHTFLVDIFLKRMGVFGKIMLIEEFSEEDVLHLSYEEKQIILNSRKIFQSFKDYNKIFT